MVHVVYGKDLQGRALAVAWCLHCGDSRQHGCTRGPGLWGSKGPLGSTEIAHSDGVISGFATAKVGPIGPAIQVVSELNQMKHSMEGIRTYAGDLGTCTGVI